MSSKETNIEKKILWCIETFCIDSQDWVTNTTNEPTFSFIDGELKILIRKFGIRQKRKKAKEIMSLFDNTDSKLVSYISLKNWISSFDLMHWPPISPGLTACDDFFWGCIFFVYFSSKFEFLKFLNDQDQILIYFWKNEGPNNFE